MSMTRRTFLQTAAGAVAAAAAGCKSSEESAINLQKIPEPKGLPLVDRLQHAEEENRLFFVDGKGKAVNIDSLLSTAWKGHPTVLAFMYRNCPLYCTNVSADLAKASKANSELRMLVISLDPERDSLKEKGLEKFLIDQKLPSSRSQVIYPAKALGPPVVFAEGSEIGGLQADFNEMGHGATMVNGKPIVVHSGDIQLFGADGRQIGERIDANKVETLAAWASPQRQR